MVKGSGLDRAQLPTHGRVCATTDGKSTSSPDQGRGCDPQSGEGKTRMGPGSAQANESSHPANSGQYPQAGAGETHSQSAVSAVATADAQPCRPDTSWFAYQDCLLALEELGYSDVAGVLRERWFDVESA